MMGEGARAERRESSSQRRGARPSRGGAIDVTRVPRGARPMIPVRSLARALVSPSDSLAVNGGRSAQGKVSSHVCRLLLLLADRPPGSPGPPASPRAPSCAALSTDQTTARTSASVLSRKQRASKGTTRTWIWPTAVLRIRLTMSPYRPMTSLSPRACPVVGQRRDRSCARKVGGEGTHAKMRTRTMTTKTFDS